MVPRPLRAAVTAVEVPGGRPAATLVLVVLLATAGCSSPLGDGDARTTYGVPERSPEPTDAAPGPGETTGEAGWNESRGGRSSNESRVIREPDGAEDGRHPDGREPNGTAGGPNPTVADGGHVPPATVPDPPDDDGEDGGRWRVGATDLAPGVSGEAVWGADRLATAHGEVLDGRSFRVRYRQVVALPGGDRRVRTVVAAVSADRRRYRVREVERRPADGPRSRVVTAHWSGEGNATLRAISYGDTRTYGRLGDAALPGEGLPGVGDPTHRSLVRRAFGATVLTAVESVPGAVAPARYWLFADGNRADRVTPGSAPVRNLSLRALVDSRGLVRTLRLSYERRDGDGWVGVTTTLAFDGVGGTDPAPPPWADDARREANESAPIGGDG